CSKKELIAMCSGLSRRPLLSLAMLSCIAVTMAITLAAFSQSRRIDNLDSAGQPAYALPFGSKPYLPSQANAAFEEFLAPGDFPPASYCGKCHEGIHAQWRQSAHANSFRAPFYLKNVQLLMNSKGIEFSRHCEGCHNPTALFTGALTKPSTVDRSFDED